jgi:hypothetical protein
VARLTTYLDLESLEIRGSGVNFKPNLTSAIGNLANQDIDQDMFPTTMPWPMTLTPKNEAVRRENHVKKTFRTKKNNRHDPRVHERCKDSITIKKNVRFCESGRRINRTYEQL